MSEGSDGNGLEKKEGKKEKGSKTGEGNKNTKKRKKKTVDADENSEEDFEPLPPTRRKRRARLDSESITAESITDAGDGELPKEEQERSDEPSVDKDEQSQNDGESRVQEESVLCNEEVEERTGLNTSTVVSYEDFLNASMMDDDAADDGKEKEDDLKDDAKGRDAPSEPLETVMLTPPDSRCSQEMSDVDQTPTAEAIQETAQSRKQDGVQDGDGEAKDELPPRKMITVKAQVHSPFDGANEKSYGPAQDSQSSPVASPALSKDGRKDGKYCPRRLMSNVSVLDSSLELTQISVESKDEGKKAGPVYSIFQKKSSSTKKEVAKDEKSETPKDTSKDGPDGKKTEKIGNEEKSSRKKDKTVEEPNETDADRKDIAKESSTKTNKHEVPKGH